MKESNCNSPFLAVDVVEHETQEGKGRLRCEIGQHLQFNIYALESCFLFVAWDERIYDALLIAAAAEFCDRTLRRSTKCWGRVIDLRIPVHDAIYWQSGDIHRELCNSLDFLTGDNWRISFSSRKRRASSPRQEFIPMELGADAVIPYSDGMDSRAVAGIMSKQLGDKLVRIRLGSKKFHNGNHVSFRGYFTAIPFRVNESSKKFVESSVRTRGFKFSLISGLGAFLAKAKRSIVPESGQGAIGPSLLHVGPVYPDYRNHPRFTVQMERFIKSLLGFEVKYEFPRIWNTKGETLRQFIEECNNGQETWNLTSSCWMDNRHAGVSGRKRQCGICAACLLRRMSVHAAGQSEPKSVYLWENLSAQSFASGVSVDYNPKKITKAKREYAIAGVLHLDHMATVRQSSAGARALASETFHLAKAMGMRENETGSKLERLLNQHEAEWSNFLKSLDPKSFITEWVSGIS